MGGAACRHQPGRIHGADAGSAQRTHPDRCTSHDGPALTRPAARSPRVFMLCLPLCAAASSDAATAVRCGGQLGVGRVCSLGWGVCAAWGGACVQRACDVCDDVARPSASRPPTLASRAQSPRRGVTGLRTDGGMEVGREQFPSLDMNKVNNAGCNAMHYAAMSVAQPSAPHAHLSPPPRHQRLPVHPHMSSSSSKVKGSATAFLTALIRGSVSARACAIRPLS